MIIELTTNLIDFFVDFDFYTGSKDTRTLDCPMGYPGDPASVKINKIYIGKLDKQMDIKDSLSQNEISHFEEACLQYALEDEYS